MPENGAEAERTVDQEKIILKVGVGIGAYGFADPPVPDP